jgi:hypothetical protein
MTYTCSIYGLGLQVNAPIAGLRGLAEPKEIDVTMSLGFMPPQLEGAAAFTEGELYHQSERLNGQSRPLVKVWRLLSGKYYGFDYADGTAIAVEASGSAVWATWPSAATIEDTATYLLGPILGFVLRLRGVPCLHASAIAMGDKAIAIVGPSGAGKSATAAAFAQLGFRVLSDDVVPLYGSGFDVQPAYPRIRLWPGAVSALFGSADALPRITPSWDKRYLDLNANGRFQSKALPLAAIYFLSGRSQTADAHVAPISPLEGMVRLVANTYANSLLSSSMRAEEFDALANLIQAVPLKLLNPSENFDGIWQLCRTIEKDFRELPKTPSAMRQPVTA